MQNSIERTFTKIFVTQNERKKIVKNIKQHIINKLKIFISVRCEWPWIE
jgi:hypothetical protein